MRRKVKEVMQLHLRCVRAHNFINIKSEEGEADGEEDMFAHS